MSFLGREDPTSSNAHEGTDKGEGREGRGWRGGKKGVKRREGVERKGWSGGEGREGRGGEDGPRRKGQEWLGDRSTKGQWSL